MGLRNRWMCRSTGCDPNGVHRINHAVCRAHQVTWLDQTCSKLDPFPCSVSFGPDSLTSSFEADTCAIQLGLPTCAQWLPDPLAFIKFLTHELTNFLGGWCLLGILGAAMCASSGALVPVAAVVSHNLLRQANRLIPNFINDDNLLFVCRMVTLPCVVIAAWIATAQSNRTQYLITLVFDMSAAGIVVPLFGCFYAKNPSPRAAIVSIVAGVSTKLILELTLPKDGSLIFPFPGDIFLKFGPAASAKYPSFIDAEPSEHWNPEDQPCDQERFNDWTGVDSLAAEGSALLCFCAIQVVENRLLQRKLFAFPGEAGYDKPKHDLSESTKQDILSDTSQRDPTYSPGGV
jgi:hypothetical protein